MPRAPQMKRRDSNDLTHMFITTYRLMTAFKRSLLGIRSGTVAETKYSILSQFDSRSEPWPTLPSSSITLRHTTLGNTPLDE